MFRRYFRSQSLPVYRNISVRSFALTSNAFLYAFHIHISVLTGWETKNKYKIKNNQGQQVFFAKEGKNALYIGSMLITGIETNDCYRLNPSLNKPSFSACTFPSGILRTPRLAHIPDGLWSK